MSTLTGRQLWFSRFGGNFVGSPVMYEMDGKQYLRWSPRRAQLPVAAAAQYLQSREQLHRWAGLLTHFPRSSGVPQTN